MASASGSRACARLDEPPDRRRRRAAGGRARSGRAAAGVQLGQSPCRPTHLHDRGRHQRGGPDGRGRGRRADVHRPASLQQRRGRVRLRAAGLRAGQPIRARRGTLGLAEEDGGRGAAARRGVRRRVSARGGRLAERAARDGALEVRPRAGGAPSRRARRARSALGQGREHLHVGRHLRGHRPRARVGGGGLRRGARARGRARARAVPAPAGRTAAAERVARLTGVRDGVDPRAADLDRRAPRARGCRSRISRSAWR